MNISTSAYHKLATTWWMLRLTYGLLFIVVGIDKFLNLITRWSQYVNPEVLKLLHIDIASLMLVVSIVEIIIGILVLTKWVKAGAYAVALWFLIIALNLVSMKMFFDIAARDTVMAIGASALALLTDVKNEITA